MSRCDDYEPLIERMLAEEIGDAERDRLLAHTEECVDCRQFVDLHYRLQDPDLAADLPAEAEFTGVRRAVLDRIRDDRAGGRPRLDGLVGFLRPLMLRPAYAAGLAALMLVMLTAGFLAGRGAGDGTFARPDDLVLDDLLFQIREEARHNRRLSDVEDSPYLYSNVTFEDLNEDRLALRFDVTRHVEVARTRDDPLVKEVLAQSLVNPAPIGTRLQAIDYAETVIDPKIEEALIFSMLSDPTLAVRMRALKILVSYRSNEEIRSAFMLVLSGEESVQMRLRAMDYLVNNSVSRERLDAILEDLQREASPPLLTRAADFGR